MLSNDKYFIQVIKSYIHQNANQKNTILLKDDLTDEDYGKYICAMANMVSEDNVPYVYAIWGLDKNGEFISTEFKIPSHVKIREHLSFNVNFLCSEAKVDGNRLVVLEVQRAYSNTIQYDGVEYILKDNIFVKASSEESEFLLGNFCNKKLNFEIDVARGNLSISEVLEYLDVDILYDLIEKQKPNSNLEVMSLLREFRFVNILNTGKYDITNLGALLLAKRIREFDNVKRKAVRVLIYEGNDNTFPAREQIGGKGYIVGFEGLIKFIMKYMPIEEYYDGIIRKSRPIFPILSIRELVANAIIHQDLNLTGGPIVSIFDNKIEISNPGKPVVEKERFIDTPPFSRNENLAAAMHRVGICEERGSGYDKVIKYIEEKNLLAPEITVSENMTLVVLKKHKTFDEMSKDELIEIVYSHACFNYVNNKITNNTSLRTRLNLSEDERYKVSRVFQMAIDRGVIKEKQGTGPKNREYLPVWA